MLRRYYGVDPADLTMDQYYGLLERVAEIVELETGHVNHRAKLDRMERNARGD